MPHATAEAHEPVPDESVCPAPRSQIRISISSREVTLTNSTLARSGKIGWCSMSGPISARLIAFTSATKMMHCGLPIDRQVTSSTSPPRRSGYLTTAFDRRSYGHRHRFAGEIRFAHIKLELETRAFSFHESALLHAGSGGDSDQRLAPQSCKIKISGCAAGAVARNPGFAPVGVEDPRCEVRVIAAGTTDEYDAIGSRAVVTLTQLTGKLTCGRKGVRRRRHR